MNEFSWMCNCGLVGGGGKLEDVVHNGLFINGRESGRVCGMVVSVGWMVGCWKRGITGGLVVSSGLVIGCCKWKGKGWLVGSIGWMSG